MTQRQGDMVSKPTGLASRFPAIADSELDVAQRELVHALGGRVRGPFTPALYSASVCDLLVRSRARLKSANPLSEDVKELVILLTVSFWSAAYAIPGHSRRAKEAGFSETAVTAVAACKKPELSAPQEVAFDLCYELLAEHKVSEATFARAMPLFGRAGIIELIGVCGHYTTVSMLLNAGEVPPRN